MPNASTKTPLNNSVQLCARLVRSFITTPLLLTALMLTALVSGHASAAAGAYWTKGSSVAPERGPGTGFAAEQLSLQLPLQNQQSRKEGLSIDSSIQITSFDWVGADAARSQYYWLSLPMRYWQQRMEQGAFHLYLEPGLMTDLDNLSSDSLMANTRLYWRQSISQDFFWQLGLVVDRRFGDLLPRPMGGLAWKSAGGTEILLGFPETRLQTGWNEHFSTYLHIRPDGGVWREELEGLDETFDVRYRNWRMGLGGELWLRGQLWLTAEAGKQRLRKIAAYDSTGARVVSEPAENNYWQAGVRLRF